MAKKNEEAEAKEAVAKRPSQNGVTRPADGTLTGRVWEIADELSKAAGEPIGRAAVLAAYIEGGGNPATGATQYGRWKTFNGLKRVAKAPKTEAASDDGAEVDE